MLIESIQCIKDLGPFKSIENVPLAKTTLIFAGNGSGKTMLSETFRSLGTNQPELVTGRKRFGANDGEPTIVLGLSDTDKALCWDSDGWTGGGAKIAVFNDGFVDANVYSGLEVTPGHRRELHSVVVGDEGVSRARKYDEAVQRAKDARAELQRIKADIERGVDDELKVDAFCGWQREPDVDQRISSVNKRLDIASHESEISRLRALSEHAAPQVDRGSLRDLLRETASDLNEAAANRVREHLKGLWDNAEEWVGEGFRNSDKPSCPYCGQDLTASQIVADYGHYFNEAYSELKERVNGAFDHFGRVSNEGQRDAMNRRHDANQELLRKWGDYGLEPGDLGTTDLAPLRQSWIDFEDRMKQALTQKAALPLRTVGYSQELDELWDRLEAHFNAENRRIRDLNKRIDRLRDTSKRTNLTALHAEALQLKRLKKRFEPIVNELCEQYLEAKERRERAQKDSGAAKESLDEYEKSTFRKYRDDVNARLKWLRAGFRLNEIQGDRPGGVVTTSYEIGIGSHSVPVKSARPEASQLSFSNTLSAGDRTSLALSYFMASLESESDLSTWSVVIDDPLSSLDSGRRQRTVETIVQLEPRVGQLIVMSHDSWFLYELKEALKSQAEPKSLKIIRGNESSRVVPWNISDARMSDTEVNFRRLSRFLTTGDGELKDVAQSIRPLLEARLQWAFPDDCDSGKELGAFVGLCESRLRTGQQLLDDDQLKELKSLNNYSKQYMHAKPPPLISEELHGYVGAALEFCQGLTSAPTPERATPS